MKKQNGFLTLVTIALVVIFGVIGIAVTYMLVGSATGALNFQLGSQAFYIAEGGLEAATRALETPFLTGTAARVSCANISSTAALTNASLGNGTYSVTSSGPFFAAPTALNGALSNSATTITVTSTANYQTSGRIMIDNELINYASKTATTFVGATRGVDGTTAASHVTGTSVGQYQCNLTSTGGIPNLTSPTNKRVLQDSVQLQEAWAVGNSSAPSFRIARFNAVGSELTWSDNSLASASLANLNGISMISDVDGWAVGASSRFLHWDGSAWTLTTVTPNATYNGVYCNSKNSCYAVGNNSGGALILSWNGTSWSRATISGSQGNNNLLSVYCTASNNCWAVGNGGGAASVFYNWNGTTWTGTNVSAAIPNGNFPFQSVYCNSTTDCWAVGATSTFARYNGSWGTYLSGLPNVQYNGIFCNNSNDCWVVGNNSGGDLFAHWNGNTWTRVGPSASVPDVAFNSITCKKTASGNTQDCWAVGVASGGDNFAHWDGTTWSRVGPSASVADVNFNDIAMISPTSQPSFAWQENFP